MAKRQKTKAFSLQGFDNRHYKTTEQYVAAVDALYSRATLEIAYAASKGTYNPDKPFSFDDYPRTKAKAESIINDLANKVTAIVQTGSRKQWLFACKKNDEFVASILDTSKVGEADLKKMQDRNLDAMQTFQSRKLDGMNLSQRVWKYTEQYKAQIELGLDVGLGEGRSAQQLSKDLRQNLQDPDRLFRWVRDKRGNLQLSKAAKAFHPGIGVYRSSAKNAARLTRSEINMAYRESDWLRWQQLDFVIGFEVQRSNHEPQCKCTVCERLVGRYPKYFKFKGWHPQCMCFATPIMEDFFSKSRSDDRVNRLKAALKGTEYKKYVSPETVTDVPNGFKDWVSEKVDEQSKWKSTPYFIKDNFTKGRLSDGLVFATKEVPKVDPIAIELQSIQSELDASKVELRNWVSISDIYDAIEAKNPTLARSLLAKKRIEMQTLKTQYNADITDARQTIADAIKLKLDVSDMQKRLDIAQSDSREWIMGKDKFKQVLNELKNKIEQKTTSSLDDIIQLMDKNKVQYKEVESLLNPLTENDIISRVGGGDLTRGSCSSLAFTYAGNKCGFDVLDFRDGVSRQSFSSSRNIMDIAAKVGGVVSKHTSDYTKASQLLKTTQTGKEYYFTCGSHAAIVRKTPTGYEYLELQSATNNGFKPLTNDVLKYRFGAKKSHSSYGSKFDTTDCIIDIDLLRNNNGFKKMLGYINTNESEQRKGQKGTMK